MANKQLMLPANRAFNSNGLAISGAQAKLYTTGTSTPANFYADSGLVTSLGSTLTANGAGRFPTAYQNETIPFRLKILDSDGAVLDDLDPFYFGYLSGVTGPQGVAGPAGDVAKAADRTALAAITGQASTATRYLVESGREGSFVWSSSNLSTFVTNDPNQGVYVAPASDTTGASGAWVRKFSGATSVKWFGTVGDGVTDDSAAIVAAIAFLKSIAGNPINTYYKASGRLLIPAGQYNCASTTIDISHTLIVEGEGGGGFGTGGGGATMLKWADGVTGIRVQEYNTSSVSTVDSSPFHTTGAYTTLRGLYLYGGYAGSASESHGIHTKTKIILDDVHVDNFSGDGLYAHTSSGGGSPTEGNSNCSRAYNCHFRNCRDGLSITGGDANAWLFLGCFFDFNRRWGVNDTTFLGNSYYGCHQDSNGITPNSATFGAAVVSYLGNRYACVYGQEATASTTAPSGDTTDTVNWYYVSSGGVNTSSLFIPAWVSGMTLRAGGPMLLYNANQNSLVSGNYTEGGQGPIQQTSLGLVQGGSNNTGVKGGSWIRGYVGNYLRTSPLIVTGNQQQWQRSGETFLIDGSQDSTSLANTNLTLKTGIVTTGTTAVNFWKSDSSVMGSLSCIANFGLIANGVLGVWLRFNGTDTANVNSTGLNIASGKNLQYNSTAVLTGGVLTAAAFPAQTGDVTNSAGSLANTITANAVTYAKFQQVAASSLVGNATGSLANATGITLGSTLAFSGSALQTAAMTGDVTASANSFATTIANNAVTTVKINAAAVTYAKIQNVAATALLGNPTGSPAAPSEITFGTGLAFSGTTAKVSPQGSSGNLQYNNSSSLGGAANLNVDASSNLRIAYASATTTPAADNTALVPQRIAASGGRLLPRYLGEDGIFQTLQSHLGRNSVYWAQGNGTAVTWSTQGGPVLTTTGTLTSRTPATTNRATRARRTGAVSSATAGNFAGWYPGGGATQQWTVGTGVALGGGGFLAIFRWVPSDAATVAGAHEFVGFHSGTTPVAATAPSALTNAIGLAQNSGSSNLQIVYGGGVAQTPIDLGASFPAGTLSVDEYELILYARPDDATKVAYRVERINTGDVASGVLTGTAGTVIPASTTFLGPKMYRSNNATALAVGIDLIDIYIENDI